MKQKYERGFLSDVQRQQLEQFPEHIHDNELIQYYLLSEDDLHQIPIKSPSYSRLGFALSLCTLRFLGFMPKDLFLIDPTILTFVAGQLNIEDTLSQIKQYGERPQTRSDHLQIIEKYLVFRRLRSDELASIKTWLLTEAMEHDRPTYLLHRLIGKLKQDRIVRPSILTLERLVSTAREQARQHTYKCIEHLLSDERKNFLDQLLVIDEEKKKTLLTWLRQRAVSSSPESIRTTLDKLAFLVKAGVPEWDLSMLSSNRLQFLNRLGKCSTNQALQRSSMQKRYSILMAVLYQSLEEILDELIDLFDQSLSQSYSRARNSLKRHHEKLQESTNEKVRLLTTIGLILLDEHVPDTSLRETLYNTVSPEALREALSECELLTRPKNDKGLDYFVKRLNYLRQYIPTFLKLITFKSIQDNNTVLCAIMIIKQLHTRTLNKIPTDSPTDFISDSWKKYVIRKDGSLDRQYYELCALWELRNRLRSGEIWIEGGRRYNNPEHYLIPAGEWASSKIETCERLQLPMHVEERLQEKHQELEQLYVQLNNQILSDDLISIKDEKISISPLNADEESPSLHKLREIINQRLPKIDLPDILIEVDKWTNFSACFHHAGHQSINSEEFPIYLYAALLSEATNLGPTAMSDITDLNYERIVWYKNWFIREETIELAKTTLVNFQHDQILSQHFGDGSFSSSDGRRVPVAVKSATAKAFVKYFGYEIGINVYSWTSDQFSQYGYKVTSPTLREATIVLDAILDNETNLNIERHTTDTAGYAEIIFALFDLIGLRFDPRIKNVGDQRIYSLLNHQVCPNIDKIIAGQIQTKIIEENWDDMLRLVASLKKGTVSTSLFVSKLHALPRKSNLAKALQEYGKIAKTLSILRYTTSKTHRKEVSAQLNKGEAVHDLQQFLHLGREGRMYARHLEEQENHFGCLNLLTNIVMIWNTVYMAEIIEQFKEEGGDVKEDDLKHLSPARHEHINPYGKYRFDLNTIQNGQLRPLREKG